MRNKRKLRSSILLFYLGLVASCGMSQIISPQDPVPLVSVGGNGFIDASFARLQFAQKELDDQNRKSKEAAEYKKNMLDSGTVSVLDLEAPSQAIDEFNRATDFLKQQKTKEAIPHLEKAIRDYPKFVSAYQVLGIAYADLNDTTHARQEFETAIQLDGKFAGSLVSLGRLELSEKNYAAAVQDLNKAAALRPRDANVLTALAYAQNYDHQYRHTIETAERVHALPHKELANIHYIAASAAIAIKDFSTVQQELERFLQEDPANPLAPNAKYNLKLLADYKARVAAAQNGKAAAIPVSETKVTTFPNSDALKRALASLGNDEDDDCADCSVADSAPSVGALGNVPTSIAPTKEAGVWTIRDTVDEVAMFFSATDRGALINDLRLICV